MSQSSSSIESGPSAVDTVTADVACASPASCKYDFGKEFSVLLDLIALANRDVVYCLVSE